MHAEAERLTPFASHSDSTHTETAHEFVLMPQLAILIQQRPIVSQLTHIVACRRHANVRVACARSRGRELLLVLLLVLGQYIVKGERGGRAGGETAAAARVDAATARGGGKEGDAHLCLEMGGHGGRHRRMQFKVICF